MLKSIQIRHYVLIESLDIDFHDGFSVMTGETGAGKSIILGAMNLLMGQRAESRVISDGADKCTVEGIFDVTGYGLQQLFDENGLDYDETDTIVRREVSATGKSRAFINDTPVSLALLREIGAHLIDIHSQHQNLLLGTESFQFSVVDSFAADGAELTAYRKCFDGWRECRARLEDLRQEEAQNRREQDFLQFQFDELEKAKLSQGEQEELESEQSILSNAEDIKAALYQASESLDGEQGGAIRSVRSALHSLESASRNLPAASELTERLQSCLIELRDINESAGRLGDGTNYDPQRLEAVSERLDLLYSLLKKHGYDSVDGLIGFRDELEAKLNRLESYSEDIKEAERQVRELHSQMEAHALQLRKLRTEAASALEKRITDALTPLGMPNATFRIQLTDSGTFDRNGADRLQFMFTANKGSKLQELSETASGGELSRVMLTVKSVMAGARNLPTIIFDEIDTGVSGAVAGKMALMMRDMCKDGRQVIAISHLPQIAAKSGAHYLVYKKEGEAATHTHISELDEKGHITEIARMISGETITAAALDNARALIEE